MALVQIGWERATYPASHSNEVYRDTDDLEQAEYHYYRKAEELGEAKRILKEAIKVINENCNGFCEYCKYYTKFNLSSCELGIDVCENNNQWEWRYADAAEKLLKED